jgi:hypothetical protein
VANPNTQLIGGLNQFSSLAIQAVALQQAIDALSAQYTAQSWATAIGTLTTMALGSDGLPGANDGSPNAAHPISTNAPPGYGLNRAATVTQYQQALTVLQAISSAVKGQAVSADAGALAILDVFIGS